MRAVNPINVGVDNQLKSQRRSKEKIIVEVVIETTKNLLRSGEVGLPPGVHVEAHLMDRRGNVIPGEGEVLQSTGEAPIVSPTGVSSLLVIFA